MAKSTDTFPAQLRSSVIQQFVSSIQSVPEGPKRDQLAAYMAAFQSSLQGLTADEASVQIIMAIADMKAIVKA